MTKSLTRALRRRALFWPSGKAPNKVSRIINSYGRDFGERRPCIRSLRRANRSVIGASPRDIYRANSSKRVSHDVRALLWDLFGELNGKEYY